MAHPMLSRTVILTRVELSVAPLEQHPFTA